MNFRLEGGLTSAPSAGVADEMKSKLEELEGQTLGMLFGLRDVNSCDDDGAGAMQKIQMGAAGCGS